MTFELTAHFSYIHGLKKKPLRLMDLDLIISYFKHTKVSYKSYIGITVLHIDLFSPFGALKDTDKPRS